MHTIYIRTSVPSMSDHTAQPLRYTLIRTKVRACTRLVVRGTIRSRTHRDYFMMVQGKAGQPTFSTPSCRIGLEAVITALGCCRQQLASAWAAKPKTPTSTCLAAFSHSPLGSMRMPTLLPISLRCLLVRMRQSWAYSAVSEGSFEGSSRQPRSVSLGASSLALPCGGPARPGSAGRQSKINPSGLLCPPSGIRVKI